MKRKRFGGDGGRKRGSFGPNRFGKGTGANRTTQPTKKRELPKEGQPPAKKQKIEKKVEEEAPPGRTSNERFRATVAKAAKRNKSKLSELEIEDSLVSGKQLRLFLLSCR